MVEAFLQLMIGERLGGRVWEVVLGVGLQFFKVSLVGEQGVMA